MASLPPPHDYYWVAGQNASGLVNVNADNLNINNNLTCNNLTVTGTSTAAETVTNLKVTGTLTTNNNTLDDGTGNVMVKTTVPLRTGYSLPGVGGNAGLTVTGSLGASVTNNEHLFQNNWSGNNVIAVQNTNTSNSFSVIRYLNPTGYERCALGYGNPDGGAAAYPFQDAAFFEASTYVNADGTTTMGVPPPIRFVQTGTMGGISFQQRRLELASDGSLGFFNLAASSMANQKKMFQIAPAGFVGIGDGSAVTGGAGATNPANNLDVFGGITVGTSAAASSSRISDSLFPINVMSQDGRLLRMIKNGVGKVDLSYNTDNAGKRLDFIDTDNVSVVPLSVMLDGSHNIALGGVPPASAFGAGVGEIWIANATTVPTANPIGGGLLYVSAGSLKFRGSAGTITTIALA